MTSIVRAEPLQRPEREEAPSNIPPIGSWGFTLFHTYLGEKDNPRYEKSDIVSRDEDSKTYGNVRVLCCVVGHGSNFIEVSYPSQSKRIHHDDIEREWVPTTVAEMKALTAKRSQGAQQKAQHLMAQIHELTARLGVGEMPSLAENASMTSALAIRGGEDPMPAYRKALAKANKTTIPDLFKKLRAAHEEAAHWLKYELVALEPALEQQQVITKRVERRIFNVELYAGLTENLVLVNPGAEPAASNEPVHLWQARKYIDEEYWARWEAGGADHRDLDGFSAWLAEPANLQALMPAPRSIFAARPRRETKAISEYSANDPMLHLYHTNMMDFLAAQAMDKETVLFIRNGAQLWRLSCKVAFPENLFPDQEAIAVSSRSSGLMAKKREWSRSGFEFASPAGVEEHVVAAGEEGVRNYKDDFFDKTKRTPEKAEKARQKAMANERSAWFLVEPNHILYDDVMTFIAGQADAHNRIVLLLQGLLDRSPALHPHPPWQLFTPEGFAAGLVLHRDTTRALVDDVMPPDFVAFLKANQKTIKKGSLVWGQENAWAWRNGVREVAARRRSYHRRSYEDFTIHRIRNVYGDPGPGVLARVEAIRDGKAKFSWSRKRIRRGLWDDKDVKDCIWVPLTSLFNVETYVPGSFRPFLADPRTRAKYLRWGGLAAAGEKFHAGLLKEGESANPYGDE